MVDLETVVPEEVVPVVEEDLVVVPKTVDQTDAPHANLSPRPTGKEVACVVADHHS